MIFAISMKPGIIGTAPCITVCAIQRTCHSWAFSCGFGATARQRTTLIVTT